MDHIMVIFEKTSGKIKGGFTYNGKPTKDQISWEEKSLTMAHATLILLTVDVDDSKFQEIISIDIPKAFIQTPILPEEI